MGILSSFIAGTGITTSMIRSLERLPIVRRLEKMLHRAYTVLIAFVGLFAVLVVSIMIIATYFLIHLIRGS